MSWRTALTWALLLAAIASGWSVWRQWAVVEETPDLVRSDFVLRDFELTSLDAEGDESFTLRGPQLQRDPGAKSMTLDTPLFLVPDRHGAYWEVRAQRGLVPDDGKHLTLHGNVVATSPADAPPPTRIETQELNLFPSDNRATSTRAVTVTRPGLTITGHGLQADFNRQQVAVNNPRNRYVPSPR